MVELCPDVFSSFLLGSNMMSLVVSITRFVLVERPGDLESRRIKIVAFGKPAGDITHTFFCSSVRLEFSIVM